MSSQVRFVEPIQLVQGDTLSFTKTLANYPASQGWSLLYELRGGAQAISFTSTASGDDHVLLVSAVTTATWLPGDYILAGYAVSATERHEIYNGELPIAENLAAAAGDEPQQTFAQQMIVNLETVMLAKSKGDLLRSAVNDTGFWYMTMEQLRTEHGYWKGVRQMEVARDRARAGLPTGMKIKPRMNVTATGPRVGMFGPGSGYGGW